MSNWYRSLSNQALDHGPDGKPLPPDPLLRDDDPDVVGYDDNGDPIYVWDTEEGATEIELDELDDDQVWASGYGADDPAGAYNCGDVDPDAGCGLCGGDLNLLGKLGTLIWLRCRDCGLDYYTPEV